MKCRFRLPENRQCKNEVLYVLSREKVGGGYEGRNVCEFHLPSAIREDIEHSGQVIVSLSP